MRFLVSSALNFVVILFVLVILRFEKCNPEILENVSILTL
jgi:hypothetical protein